MRHLYECPVRWADLDLRGYVSNVVFVDYLQEARVDMLRINAPHTRAEDLTEGVVVVRHEVEYLVPVPLRFTPLKIETWVTEIRAASFTMGYEVFDDAGASEGTDEPAERVVHLRASTVLTPYLFGTERPRRLRPDEREALEPFLEPLGDGVQPASRRTTACPPPTGPVTDYPVRVRFSDVDAYGHVNNVTYYEYFQEARIRLVAALGPGLDIDDTAMVVAGSDVDYRLPILMRAEPYDCRSWVSEADASAIAIASEIHDGDQLLARSRTELERAPSAVDGCG